MEAQVELSEDSIYRPAIHTNMAVPPWEESPKQPAPSNGNGKPSGGFVNRIKSLFTRNEDPLGIRLNGQPADAKSNGFSGPDFTSASRIMAQAIANSKTPKQAREATKALRDLNKSMVNNVLFSRAGWLFEQMLDPAGRDLFRECGYPFSILPQMYREMYDRDGIARRVVDIWPDECWEHPPDIYEDEDETENTDFEIAYRRVQEQMGLTSEFELIDKLCGIGSYGLILFGIDDGKLLNEPIEGLDEGTGELLPDRPARNLLYIRCFDESLCYVGRWNTNQQSPRYGLPEVYLVRFLDYSTVPVGQTATGFVTHMVHWSRVVHIADERKSSTVFGTPRMQPVFNRLLDLRKLYGGSAEMFWKGGFPGLGLEVLPELADAEIDQASVRNQMTEYQNGLQRWFAVAGMSVKTLTSNIALPKQHIDAQMESIAVAIRVPKRVFLGSEQAVKASQQDSDAWDVRLMRRKDQYLTPRLVRPCIDRLIAMGVFPIPKRQYHCHWPDSSAPTMKDKAHLATSLSQAISNYMTCGGDQLIAPLDFFVTVLGIDRVTAMELIKATQKYSGDQHGTLPTAGELAVMLGIQPREAKTILGAIEQRMVKMIEQQESEESESSESNTSDPYQPPSMQISDSGLISGGYSGGIGSSGGEGDPGGGGSGAVPWRV